MFNANTRPQGVQIPQGQLQAQGQGAPKSVVHVVPAEMVAVQYADENGDLHNTMLVKVGNQVYHAPNGEQWARQLRPAATWLADHVNKEIDSHAAPIPDDAVDVFPKDEVNVAVQETTEEIDAQNQESPA
jgi:hypothetical protein